jgi:hypothetical protein
VAAEIVAIARIIPIDMRIEASFVLGREDWTQRDRD